MPLKAIHLGTLKLVRHIIFRQKVGIKYSELNIDFPVITVQTHQIQTKHPSTPSSPLLE